jgi:hypothetical protein
MTGFAILALVAMCIIVPQLMILVITVAFGMVAFVALVWAMDAVFKLFTEDKRNVD